MVKAYTISLLAKIKDSEGPKLFAGGVFADNPVEAWMLFRSENSEPMSILIDTLFMCEVYCGNEGSQPEIRTIPPEEFIEFSKITNQIH